MKTIYIFQNDKLEELTSSNNEFDIQLVQDARNDEDNVYVICDSKDKSLVIRGSAKDKNLIELGFFNTSAQNYSRNNVSFEYHSTISKELAETRLQANSKIRDRNRKNYRLNKTNSELSEQIKNQLETIESKDKEIAELSEQIKNQLKTIESKDKEIAELKAEMGKTKEQIKKHLETIKSKNDIIAQKDKEIAGLKAEMEKTKEQKKQIKNRHRGRVSKYDAEEILRMKDKGLTQRQIAEIYNCTDRTICNVLKRYKKAKNES